MSYPFLTVLNLISLIIFVGLGVFLFGLLVKKWARVDWKESFKVMSGYILISILVYFIYPYPILSSFFELQELIIIDFVLYSLLLFIAFHLLAKKVLDPELKKSIASFVLIVMIVFPVLGFLNNTTLRFAENFGPFREESEEIQENISRQETEDDLFFRMGSLTDSVFWQASRLQEVVIMID